VELKDVNSSTQEVLYRAYFYIPDDNAKSRFKIDSVSDDLKIAQATRKAEFQVTALIDSNGSLIHGDFTQDGVFDSAINNHNATEKFGYSDLFAIRPLGYYFEVKDNGEHNHTRYAQNDIHTDLDLAAQYDYTLNIHAISDMQNTIATQYKTLGSQELNTSLTFDDRSTCIDQEDRQLVSSSNFNNGVINAFEFSHHNVGAYKLEIQDINWTYIDQHDDPELAGCVMGSSANTKTNDRYGCNFSSKVHGDFGIDYQAYEFNLSNTRIENLSGTTQDYLYMGLDLNSQNMGVQLSTDIIAVGAKGGQLSNYTSSCVAKDVSIDLNYLVTDATQDNNSSYENFSTIEGTVQPLQRAIVYNENNVSFDVQDSHFSNVIAVPKGTFLDSNEGNMSLDIFYNITKNTSEPMNPIRLNFLKLNADSNETTHQVENEERTAKGQSNSGLINAQRTFYFSRVAPDLENYPATKESNITTPLSIEIFCDTSRVWCQQMIPSEVGLNSVHTIYGWYTARQHDSSVDGNFDLELPTASPDNEIHADLTSTRGRYEDVIIAHEGFEADDETNSVVTIEVAVRPDPWLRYHPDPSRNGDPFYNVKFQNQNFGILSGVGESGNLIETGASTGPTNKLAW